MDFVGSIAVFLPSKADADRLAEVMGQPDYGPEDMHLTLTYIGGEFVQQRDIDATTAEMRKMARRTAPFTVKVTGVGYLGKDEAVVAHVDSQIVVDAQARLSPLCPPSKFPGYIPHVTLGYKGNVDMVNSTVPEGITFSRMAVFTNGSRTEFPLTG
jgi:2'-5' RNA ligase